MTLRSVAKEAWYVVRGIAFATPRRLSWREALRELRSSLVNAALERLVGIVVLSFIVAVVVALVYVTMHFWTAVQGS